MLSRRLLRAELSSLSGNPEQKAAILERGHCVVQAGPGSGKTKTLTLAMASALAEDVTEPRGVACITYNNECALELETRLGRLGVEPNRRVFIGTVHSFALTQVVFPYARCVMAEISSDTRVATAVEMKNAIEVAYHRTIGGRENPHERWKFAEEKRRREVNRSDPAWRGHNPELAEFIEAYEGELRRRNLIDYDDMPLLALRIVDKHTWVRRALRAKFPVLFVDEYQDLGHALHELVLTLCFEAGIRLFAVGDPDQSIYGFQGANPDLLAEIAKRKDVCSIRLRFNYRCGKTIIDASMAALGEDRDYKGPDGAEDGIIDFHPLSGENNKQADYVFSTLVKGIQNEGTPLDQIAILYRWKNQGDELALAAAKYAVPIVRTDANALLKRNSRLSRLIEACAGWVSGGWKLADPPFRRLSEEATAIVFGQSASDNERHRLQIELMNFLRSSLGSGMATHEWLGAFQRDVLREWRTRSRTIVEDWDLVDAMIQRTDPHRHANGDLPLAHFGGRAEGDGRVNMSTLHSAKGREFDVVILFAMNNDVIPTYRESRNDQLLREVRRQFYVGVTRARKVLHIVFRKGAPSHLVGELHDRIRPER